MVSFFNKNKICEPEFVQNLCDNFNIVASNHSCKKTFKDFKDLKICNSGFVCTDAVKKTISTSI